MNTYDYGNCSICNKTTWLKNGKCSDCNDVKDDSNVVDDLMKMFGVK